MGRLRNLLWPRRQKHRVLMGAAVLVVFCVVGPFLYVRILSSWRALDVQTIRAHADRSVASESSDLRLVCYNIAHGRGLAESNASGGNAEARLKRLDDLADLLAELGGDVVVLNEVDFNASWSYSIDQADYLAAGAGYPYIAKLSNIDFRVAHRSWRFGNAVLSRYPIVDAYEIDLPGYAVWETVLAGKKRALLCEIEKGGSRFGVVAVHLSHRSEGLRVASVRRLIDFSKGYGVPLILAGDFNSTPSGTPGSRADPRGDNAMDLLEHAGRFGRYPDVSSADVSRFTFRSDRPSKVIDWVLFSEQIEIAQGFVEPSELSDHRPVVVDLVIGDSAAR